MPVEHAVRNAAATAVVGASLALGASAAQAADLYIPAPDVIVTESEDWTGFYAGGHIGYGWGIVVVEDAYGMSGDQLEKFNYRISGWLAGGQAGYNKQMGNVVVGIEKDISLAGITGNSGTQYRFGVLGTDVNWIATLRGRAGVTFDDMLLYVTGGISAAGVNSWVVDTFFNSDRDKYEYAHIRYGIVAGFGAEKKLDENWSVKAEYQLHSYGKHEVDLGMFDNQRLYVVDDLTLHTVKLGINYNFN
jgi:opacity protein-like surface antigen